MSATVYFSRTITPEKVLELYQLAGKELPGKVAVKVHSGEKGNQNFLGPDFWRPTIEYVGGTLVECNTAYEGARNVTERHIQLMEYHGWIETVGNQSYKCRFEAWKVGTQLDRTDADLSGVATPETAATACEPPILCATGIGSLYIAKKDQRGPTESSFKDRKHPGEE